MPGTLRGAGVTGPHPPRVIPGHLIWPDVCQVPSTKGPQERAFVLVEGAAGAGVARRAVRLICAGWVPQDRGFVSEPAV